LIQFHLVHICPKLEMEAKVTAYLEAAKQWQPELMKLREVLLTCELEEDFKWRAPCYTWRGQNVVLLGGFKAHCLLAFVKGALLSDPEGVLVQQGPNTQGSRSFQFTSLDQIERQKRLIVAFVREAIQLERDGAKVIYAPPAATSLPPELQQRLEQDAVLKAAFEGLTPGRRRAYCMHIGAAKQATTRLKRVDAAYVRILAGKGLHDCICGKSKRMPTCDGSHRND
jgi:uncharacterized protein YdeI (YjbR/CyaY-like superfamily)